MHWKRLTISIAAASLMLAACSPGEELAEQLLESQDGTADVEIDADSGQISVEGEGEDGGSFSIGGGEIPEGFPIDVPSGGEIQSVMDTEGEALVAIRYEEGFEEIRSFFEDWISDNGDVTNTTETSQPPSVTWVVEDGDRTYSISIIDADPFVQATLIAQGGN